MMLLRKLALIFMIFLFTNFKSQALNLDPVLTDKIMGTFLRAYQLPYENYIFDFFESESDFEKLESEEKTALFFKGDEFYFIGETDKNMTGFILQGKTKFMVKAIGQIAYKKLLDKANSKSS